MQRKMIGYATGVFESISFLSSSELAGTEWDCSLGLQNQPEKRLMLAILVDAVECFQKYAPAKPGKADRLFTATEEWIFQDDHRWPFSFINICDAVGIDPKYLRNGLQQWSQTRSRKVMGTKRSLAASKLIRASA